MTQPVTQLVIQLGNQLVIQLETQLVTRLVAQLVSSLDPTSELCFKFVHKKYLKNILPWELSPGPPHDSTSQQVI